MANSSTKTSTNSTSSGTIKRTLERRQNGARKLAGLFALLASLSQALVLLILVLEPASQVVECGNKGNKGGMEDIILYNGNIVLRGDKKGGSIVLANQHPHNEEVEFAPSYFGGFGDLAGGFGRRRRR